MRIIKEHSVFVFIFFVCIILRFIPFFDYQFTLDELSGLDRTQFSNFDDLIEKGVKTTDTHPALVQLLIFALAKLFGYTNWIIKLPFLAFGFGAIIYAYLFCLRNFSKQSGVFAALIFSFSLIFVFYAPIARMYISGVFFSIALLYYFFELLFLKNAKFSNYFFIALFALLSALNQHINALFAFTVCLSGFLFLNRTNFKPYVIACAAAVIFYLPHLPVTLHQLEVGGIGFDQGGWLPKPESDSLFSFLKVLFGTGKSYLIFLVFILLALILNRKITLNKKQIFLAGLFLVNYFIIYFYSIFRAPVFQNSVMLFSSVAFIIFISSLLEFRNRSIFFLATGVIASVLIYKTYFKKAYYTQAVKTVFEYQFERTLYYKKLFGENAVYPIFFDADIFMKKMYFDRYHTHFDCKITSDSLVGSIKLFAQFVSNLKSDYLVLASAMPAQQAIARDQFPYLIESTQTQGINYKVYSKKKLPSIKVIEDDKPLHASSVNEKGIFVYKESYGKFSPKNELVFYIDSTQEYPFDAKAPYSQLISHEGQVILLKAQLQLKNVESTQLNACISVNNTMTQEIYAYSATESSDFVVNSDSLVTLYTNLFIGTNHKHVKDKSTITCYLWNKYKENCELKNFEIKVIDFWPQKWQFWD